MTRNSHIAKVVYLKSRIRIIVWELINQTLTENELDRRLIFGILIDVEKMLHSGRLSDDYCRYSKLGLQNEPNNATFLLRTRNRKWSKLKQLGLGSQSKVFDHLEVLVFGFNNNKIISPGTREISIFWNIFENHMKMNETRKRKNLL